MKDWYKKPATKGILILSAHILAVFVALSIMINMTFSGNVGSLLKNTGRTYQDSASFKNMVYNAAWEVMAHITMKNNFESDGKYNPNKLVDIINFGKDHRITGQNDNGLAYRLEDLVNWSSSFKEGGGDYSGKSVVVCQKPDGTYFYYYMENFKTLIQDNKLKLDIKNMSSSDFINELEQGDYTSGFNGDLTIRNEKGDVMYVDCWTFDDALKEKYAPQGAADILDVMNKTPELNGKLSTVYGYLQSILGSLSDDMNKYLYMGDSWEEGNTNLTYMYMDQGTKKIYTNDSRFKDYGNLKESLEQMKAGKHNKYLIISPKLSEFVSNMDISASEWQDSVKSFNSSQKMDCIFAVSVNTKFPIQDAFYADAKNYNAYAPYLRMAAVGSMVCSVLFFVILIWLTLVAGRKGQDGEVHLNAFDRWKSEIAAAVVIILWSLPVVFIGGGIASSYSRVHGIEEKFQAGTYQNAYDFSYNSIHLNAYHLILAGLLAAFTTACFLIGYLSLIRRIKAGTVWNNSLLRSVFLLLNEFWKNRSVAFKSVLLLAAFVLIHWICLSAGGLLLIVMLLTEGAAAYLVIKGAIAKGRIKKGIREISGGNVNYKITLDCLKGENQEMAEMVNDIGNGLQRAVEEGMKSERLKTDLITNVSHDIKTPLTSIINYVDLLKREHFEDPKIQSYLDILEDKAQRLKTLTEDVVEASKVSSGNIVLEFMDVNLVEMINQTAGEFTEKFEARELEMVQNLPGEPALIHVDGKRMWRILENIYNNAAKYAMPGTRVYADLWVDYDKVSFSLKNISQQPLNINADELTERFIRGDISRGTEGSGLGLSIAKSLTNMQKGEFHLYLDGDLFKVTIEFPRVK